MMVSDDSVCVEMAAEQGILNAFNPLPGMDTVHRVFCNGRWLWLLTRHTHPGDSGWTAIGLNTHGDPEKRKAADEFLASLIAERMRGPIFATGVAPVSHS